MKRNLALILALALCLALFGCNVGVISGEDGPTKVIVGSQGESSQAESSAPVSSQAQESSAPVSSGEPAPVGAETVRVAALKGPTGMGLAPLMCADSAVYQWTLAASADEITPKLLQGELDVAAVPANLASVLYNKTQGEIQVLGINTLGVLYIVENGDTVHTVEDLRGKTVYSAGKGATPQYALEYLLAQSGLAPETDVTIQWKSEHTECLSALLAGEDAVAMLPQPFVTTAQMKNEGVRVALDLNALWEETSPSGALITGVAVARKAFVEENPELVKQFLEDYAQSVETVNAATEEAAGYVEEAGILKKEVALKAIPQCNITWIAGNEMREKLSGYLQTLLDQDPKAIGGALPSDDFYYLG